MTAQLNVISSIHPSEAEGYGASNGTKYKSQPKESTLSEILSVNPELSSRN